MNPTQSLTKDQAFFFGHAGYSYDPITQTPEQGRTLCAINLAAAEEKARNAGVSFAWSIDPDCTSADWKGNREDGGKYRNPWQTWICCAYDANGELLDSLGGIDFGRDGSPWGDTYRRVCEAEIAAGLELE